MYLPLVPNNVGPTNKEISYIPPNTPADLQQVVCQRCQHLVPVTVLSRTEHKMPHIDPALPRLFKGMQGPAIKGSIWVNRTFFSLQKWTR